MSFFRLINATFYAVPPEYHVNLAYRYAFVNDEVILVDPYSRRVVEVIDQGVDFCRPAPVS